MSHRVEEVHPATGLRNGTFGIGTCASREQVFPPRPGVRAGTRS